MSKHIIYTCDRCKQDALGVHVVDLGNDYSVGRTETGQKVRVAMELCSECWKSLMIWLRKSDEGCQRDV